MIDKKNKNGRPPFVVTEDNTRMVEQMSGMGVPQEQIASIVGCSVDTLFKYFEEQMKLGKGKANFKVAQTLYQQAVKGNVPAAIFWLKTQAKFKETDKLEITGADGGPIEINEAKSKLLAGINKEEKKDD